MVKAVFDELALSPMGRTLQKALDAVAPLPALSRALIEMRDQMLPRIRSRLKEYRLSEEAEAVFKSQGATPHVISLARSHSWYAPALPPDFKAEGTHTAENLYDAAKAQLATRQGIDAADGQMGVATVSTMMLLRSILGTTPSHATVLGSKVAWDGYNLPPAFEARVFETKPEGQGWRDYIEQNFKDPKKDVGAIFVTSPCSLTGRHIAEKELRDLLDLSDQYGIRLVLNQVHATPGFDGTLPEPQTGIIRKAANKNLVVIASTTKQLSPYAVAGLENVTMNIFYAPNPALVKKITENIAQRSTETLPPESLGAAVELLKASDHDFHVKNQQASQDRRMMVDHWLSGHKGVGWYNGERPDTTYQALLTFSMAQLEKTGVTTPQQLYDYILFSTGLDPAPIVDSGVNGADRNGGLTFRMNYSLPENELKLVMKLMDVAIDKMDRGVTLDQVLQHSQRAGGTRLRADNTAPPIVQAPANSDVKSTPPKP